jgi:hypothetical protein
MKHIKLYEGFLDKLNQKILTLNEESKREIEICLQTLMDDYDIGYYRVISEWGTDILAFVYKLNEPIQISDKFKADMELANKKLSHIGLEIKFGKLQTNDAYNQLGVSNMNDWDIIVNTLLKFKNDVRFEVLDILIVDKDSFNDHTKQIINTVINQPRA